MRIITCETGTVRTEALTVPAGGAVAVAGVGVVPALAGFVSPLRTPFTLFHLFATPAAALYAWPPELDRLTASAAGALVVNLLVAHTMSAPNAGSARNYVLPVSVSAPIIHLPAHASKTSETPRTPKAPGAPGTRNGQFRGRM